MLENRLDSRTVSELRMCWANGASQGSSKCASTTSSRGQTARWGSQGSESGSVSAASARAPLTTEPGNGKSMLAQTPSCRPGVAPRWAERRCVNQRSMPRVGTETTSAAMGSSRGSATTSRSIPTSVSARSDRWTCSTPAEYVGGVSVRPAPPAPLLGGLHGATTIYAVPVLAPPSGSATMVGCVNSSSGSSG